MDKKNNNKLKQYKKKLTTKGRVDMSKGGRVKAAVGGPQQIKTMQPVKKKPIRTPIKTMGTTRVVAKPKPLKKAPVQKQPIPSEGGLGRRRIGHARQVVIDHYCVRRCTITACDKNIQRAVFQSSDYISRGQVVFKLNLIPAFLVFLNVDISIAYVVAIHHFTLHSMSRHSISSHSSSALSLPCLKHVL